MTESNQGPATPGTAARCEDDLDLIASALGLTPYQGSNNRTIDGAEEAVSRLRALVERARAETLNEAAKEVDLVAAEYIGQAGEAEFDPNWIAGESLQGAAEHIRSLIPVGDGAAGPRAAPHGIPEIERLKAENASLLESLRESREELARLQRTVADQEAAYLKEHGHWGECSHKARAAAAEQRAEAAEKERDNFAEQAGEWQLMANEQEQRAIAAEKEKDEAREAANKNAAEGLRSWKERAAAEQRAEAAEKDRDLANAALKLACDTGRGDTIKLVAAERRNTALEGAVREWAEAVRAVDTFIDFGTPAESAEDPWVAPTEPEEMNAAMLRLYELLTRYDTVRAALHDEERSAPQEGEDGK